MDQLALVHYLTGQRSYVRVVVEALQADDLLALLGGGGDIVMRVMMSQREIRDASLGLNILFILSLP